MFDFRLWEHAQGDNSQGKLFINKTSCIMFYYYGNSIMDLYGQLI